MPLLESYIDEFYQAISNTDLEPLREVIPTALKQRFDDYQHGFLHQWLNVLEQLPRLPPQHIDLKDRVSVGQPRSASEIHALSEQLKGFHPWRKGPYFLHGLHIDTEWRSDWKWERIINRISRLEGRTVLDVGCGNGYHCWRMLGAGSQMVLGIDPSQLFWMQFLVIKHFLGPLPVHFLPLGIEAMPANVAGFDTVFSMGVLYHRKSPFEHLQQLRNLLREGGELVLETLVLKQGDTQTVLVPQQRYACMANVWFIPSLAALQHWLYKAGYKDVSLIDVSGTTPDEQRSTEWMQFQSLQDFLDPKDHGKTIEGYPAPLRATFKATK